MKQNNKWDRFTSYFVPKNYTHVNQSHNSNMLKIWVAYAQQSKLKTRENITEISVTPTVVCTHKSEIKNKFDYILNWNAVIIWGINMGIRQYPTRCNRLALNTQWYLSWMTCYRAPWVIPKDAIRCKVYHRKQFQNVIDELQNLKENGTGSTIIHRTLEVNQYVVSRTSLFLPFTSKTT